ncbi:pentatricopeptide repeat-containing protein At2g22410, mitochondrial-like [Arachis hypogaea]|uniref:pentatricopeptide repeat-containing protein At2g22410, mitochondrial-like n=1 Tax=Arachis hypogaea TaxID=3818 RepID=UPI000DED2774|nr:pentatricopeptide repeat-containing protein At2g22410, mitochondrial-like isoform X1 [Arachis hypogaea]XP_025663872.1 pentatricopeptide repeat-containing protein At2g22410, mitochondrial-like isoform X1 [Arachis hypogaea]QHO26083.1 Pentatricopeptide repeat-containing protein [Arachis hypogaea]
MNMKRQLLTNQSLKIKALLSSCKTMQQGLQIHAYVILNGCHHDILVQTSLISFFASLNSSSSLHHCRLVFSQVTTPDTFLWNAMVKAHSYSHTPQYTITFYRSMLNAPASPDSFTYPFVIKSCARLLSPKLGFQVQCHVMKNGCVSDIFVVNALLHMYCVLQETPYACRVFDESPVRDIVSYNTMMSGFVQAGRVGCVFRVFKEMGVFGIEVDEYTIVALLSVCNLLEDFKIGKQVHCLACKKMCSNDVVMNALVDMYARCGCLDMAERVMKSGVRSGNSVVAAWTSVVSAYARRGEVEVARRLFNQMDDRDLVSWTAMINGYSNAGYFQEALDLFVQLEDLGLKPDVVAVVAALSACARLGALDMGRRIHCRYAAKNWPDSQDGGFIAAVVDMYAKCGSIDTALDIFNKTSDSLKTTLLYNSIISGLAHHGHGEYALTLFKEMKLLGLKPDEVTFVALLCAFGHNGLVDDGLNLFESMLSVYGINPQMEHYGCMVDLLGRAGHLNEAYGLISNMPFKANAVIWRAFLSACKLHGDVELAKIAGQELLKMEHDHGAGYVMLSNMLADAAQHEEAASVRKEIDEVGIQKPPGWSYVEMNEGLHKFVAGDKSHPEAKATELMLRDINMGLKSFGQVINVSKMVFDID